MNETAIHWYWLQYMVKDHLWIDFWRCIVIFLAFFGIGAAFVWIKSVPVKTFSHALHVTTNTLLCLYIALQESQQIGAKMLVWRLPYETLLLVFVYETVRVSRRKRDRAAVAGTLPHRDAVG